MPTATEKKALLFLATVALSGSAVRVWRAATTDHTPAEAAGLQQQVTRVESARNARHAEPRRVTQSSSHATPESTATRPIDLDAAAASEIEVLPGIGPALAKRIVAHRDSAGPFGDLDALCEVRGIGPSLAKRLRPLVTFTGPHRPVSAACGAASKKSRGARDARSPEPR